MFTRYCGCSDHSVGFETNDDQCTVGTESRVLIKETPPRQESFPKHRNYEKININTLLQLPLGTSSTERVLGASGLLEAGRNRAALCWGKCEAERMKNQKGNIS
jgi:hypothetical protein